MTGFRAASWELQNSDVLWEKQVESLPHSQTEMHSLWYTQVRSNQEIVPVFMLYDLCDVNMLSVSKSQKRALCQVCLGLAAHWSVQDYPTVSISRLHFTLKGTPVTQVSKQEIRGSMNSFITSCGASTRLETMPIVYLKITQIGTRMKEKGEGIILQRGKHEI